MCIERTNYCNNERYVVEVDAEKFLKLWRRCPYDEQAGEIGWRGERKYGEAEKCFLLGIENPVPLADVNCNIHRERVPIYSRTSIGFKRIDHYRENTYPYIGFTNGVTRTLWLLKNGAKVFPV